MNWFKRFLPPKPAVPTDGMKAADAGFRLEDNPFQNPSPSHSIWRDDWLFSKRRRS